MGRWTQQDPVAGSLFNANGQNHYVFAGDDPVNQVDPSGLDAYTVACISVAVVSVVALLFSTFVSGGLGAVFLLTAFDFEYAAVLGCFLGVLGALVSQAVGFSGL